MPPTAPPLDLAALVLAKGRVGLARVEIAAELGMTLGALEGRAKEDAALGEALELADEAAEAWWLALPRRALAAGRGGLNGGLWRAAMDWRFGEADVGAPPPGPPKPRVIVDLPYNGRDRGLGRPEPPGDGADWVEKVQFWVNQRNRAQCEARAATEELEELGFERGDDEDDQDDGDDDGGHDDD